MRAGKYLDGFSIGIIEEEWNEIKRTGRPPQTSKILGRVDEGWYITRPTAKQAPARERLDSLKSPPTKKETQG